MWGRKEAGPQKEGFCRKVLRKVSHNKKPVDEKFCIPQKVLQSFGSQAQIFRPRKMPLNNPKYPLLRDILDDLRATFLVFLAPKHFLVFFALVLRATSWTFGWNGFKESSCPLRFGTWITVFWAHNLSVELGSSQIWARQICHWEGPSMDQYHCRGKLQKNFQDHWSIRISPGKSMDQWLVHYEFPPKLVGTNAEISMDQWRSRFSESFSLDRHWSIECPVSYFCQFPDLDIRRWFLFHLRSLVCSGCHSFCRI